MIGFHPDKNAIGTGAYSRVMAGSDRTAREWTPVAVKVLDKAAMTEDDVRVFKSEISVLDKINAINPPFW